MNLADFDNHSFDRGRSAAVEALWMLLSALFVESWLPGSAWRTWLLRRFGARIGSGVVLKPGIRIKFPWRLEVGDHTWIGERSWIDNLAAVRIGNHACLSQGVYLCTGNHDWSDPRFRLLTGTIEIGDQAWIGARSVLGPGARVGVGSVVALGAVVTGGVRPWTIVAGNPAREVKVRRERGAAAENSA